MDAPNRNSIANGTRAAASEHPNFPGIMQGNTKHRCCNFEYLIAELKKKLSDFSQL
jgi:hypothetical protein